MSGKVYPLQGQQALAVDPADSVWLSASAGTGKTQVLSARVLRLLLRENVRPEQLLCLTFTKAGAAEMATRVNEVLANWVRMSDEALAGDLFAIGADVSEITKARARSLFAHVLDCPGGGLRIDTIHAFSQWLLAAFPEEAGLIPGTRPMEDRDREMLAHNVLADLLVDWERGADDAALSALEALSVRMGADGARGWLMRCAEARDVWQGAGALQPPMRGRVEALLGLPADTGLDSLAALCGDDVFDTASLRHCLAVNLEWGTATGSKCADAITDWLASPPAERADQIEALNNALFTQKDDIRSLKNLQKLDADIGEMAERVRACIAAVRELAVLIDLAAWITPALEVGRKFALAWDEAKQREGLIDFDDLIRRAAALLAQPGLGEWIRYKLDRQFDHILIDEAQDTNEAQWSIIGALTDDFFSGEGQRGNILRTIFVVGDYKQAIFRFQGTSPENFAAARRRFALAMAERAENARTLRENVDARELRELGLGRSYRTAQSVLGFVDNAITAIGHEAFGLSEKPDQHIGDNRAGLVTMWQPVPGQEADDGEDGEGGEGWVSEPERRMADRIASQIRQWMDHGFPLVKDRARNAGPGDIMVLVRKRRALAGLIVARLHAARVPVAGVDRLRLGAPLAVQDLMAALRFAAQPLDDLSLGGLLVSPLIGWSQEQLLEHGWQGPDPKLDVGLWRHLQRSTHADAKAVVASLKDLLARADYEPPQALLHWMLVGPWGGRKNLVARLGREANDPIDELLNAALAYAAAHTPSLAGFIQWFDAGEGELKREAGSAEGLVRVMTVHGSKGLQSPIVILADAAGDPDRSLTRGLELEEQLPGGNGRKVPLPDLSKAEKAAGPIAAVADAAAIAERQEHWRLLYVAMTRAEEALFIGGALGKRETEPAADSWFARLAPLFDDVPREDAIWGWRMEHGEHATTVPLKEAVAEASSLPLPDWATRPIGPEPRPPRPLAPSAAGDDVSADPPMPPEVLAAAARRGVLMHALLERLPDVPPDQRQGLAAAWLARRASDLTEAARAEMLERALAVLVHPDWADLFGPAALAEVPLAATVGGQVIAGTADRLLVEKARVLVADFKTARRPPVSLEQMPVATLRQMAAYAAALAVIYPGRRVEAAVLYTQTPQLIAIPAETLALHNPHLAPAQ